MANRMKKRIPCRISYSFEKTATSVVGMCAIIHTVPRLSGISHYPRHFMYETMAFQTFSVKWPKAENLDFPSGQTLVRASILLVFCLETTFVFLH